MNPMCCCTCTPDQERFKELVATAMVRELEVLDVTAPMDGADADFRCRAKWSIVMDGAKFLGLITRIDLLNYLRRRVQ